MLTIFDHLFAAALIVGLTIIGTLKWKKIRQRLRDDPDRYRVREYRNTILEQWGLVAALLVLWIWQQRPLSELGLGLPLNWGTLAGAMLSVPIVALFVLQLKKIKGSTKIQERLRKSPSLANVNEILPHKPRELRWFIALSITAGICEETLYRGFLIWYLHQFMPLWPAVILAAAAFGSAHAYQGLKGIPHTGMVGLIMALLYLLTGSLWIPMFLHAVIDINGGQTGMAVFGGGQDGNTTGASKAGALTAAPTQPDSIAPDAPAAGVLA